MKVISRYIVSLNDAGPKAKVDIENILRNQYDAEIVTYKMKSEKNDMIEKIKKTIFFFLNCHSKDVLVCQHPLINIGWLYRAKHKVCIVHDLGYFRTYDKNMLDKEIKTLSRFDDVIVHNERMYNFLKEKGLKSNLIILEFFDYLTTKDIKKRDNKFKNPTIIYPGNWDKNKASFLYDLDESKMKFNINIYGPNKSNSNELNNKKIKFKGCFSPEEIIEKMEGNLGLVWSGKLDDSDRDIGDKKYNIYNTPHKLSCFLAAGIPVIVWEDSAIADVVKKYNIGYTINNIYDINNINFSNYSTVEKNAQKIGKKIREGYYTKRALKKCTDGIKDNK